MVKNLPAVQERRVQSGRSPGEGNGNTLQYSFFHSSILAWEIPWIEQPGGLQSMGSQKRQIQFSS